MNKTAVKLKEEDLNGSDYLSPVLREKLSLVRDFKKQMDKADGSPFPFYQKGKEVGMDTTELALLSKMDCIEKDISRGKKDYRYTWVGPEPDRNFIELLIEESKELQKQVRLRNKKNREEKKKRLAEEEKAKKEAEARRIQELKEERERARKARKSQGSVLDPDDLEFINNLKAKVEGITPEVLDKAMAPKEEEKVMVPKSEEKPTIPISVKVTTEGNRKTVSIEILV